MDVTTQDGTDVKLPLDYSVEISEKDYIIFVEHVDSLDIELEELEGKAKIEKEEAQKVQLEQLKKGLMQQLLTGKKRVKV